jgi:glycerol-3-phosphate acyltransferase PlsY
LSCTDQFLANQFTEPVSLSISLNQLVRAYFLIAIVSYFVGSIPFGFILVRIFRGEDVRKTGSGNIGATNVSRTSPALGAITLLLDALKGFTAVALAYQFFPGRPSVAAVAAVCAIVGHMFPLWLKFRGGKGVATGLGSFVMLAPKAILVMVGLFLLIVLVSRYVSLGSILAVALLPLLAWLLDGYRNAPCVLAMMAAASILVIVKHRDNIRRLMAGTESKLGRP